MAQTKADLLPKWSSRRLEGGDHLRAFADKIRKALLVARRVELRPSTDLEDLCLRYIVVTLAAGSLTLSTLGMLLIALDPTTLADLAACFKSRSVITSKSKPCCVRPWPRHGGIPVLTFECHRRFFCLLSVSELVLSSARFFILCCREMHNAAQRHFRISCYWRKSLEAGCCLLPRKC